MASEQKGTEAAAPAKSRLDEFLFKPTDIAPLVYFRIIFGSIMFWEVTRFFNSDKISRYFMEPEFFFPYYLFEWVAVPLPGYQMNLFFLGMGILYAFLVIGLWYRVVSVLCFVGFFYWFFLDMTLWLNHFYLVLLISFVMMFVPAHRNASLDAIRNPEIRVATVPAWTRWLLTFQVSIPYFLGSFPKLNSDWIVHGEPMRMWLWARVDNFPLIGHLFAKWWAPYFFSWNGFLYDLIIVPLLLWPRTRIIAIPSTIFFHLMNDQLFQIGIFPWFMMFATPLFFEPKWVRPVLNFEWIFCKPVKTDKDLADPPRRRPIVKWLFCSYFAILFLMPLRKHFYPGDTNWTEEGYLYSWHMMLRDKDGWAHFYVTYENSGKEIEVDQDRFLNNLQQRRMLQRPDMLVRFGNFVCEHYSKGGKVPVRVTVDNKIGLNGRKRQRVIDPKVDLCKAKVSFRPAPWILPLEVPISQKNVDYLEDLVYFTTAEGRGSEFNGTRVAKESGDDIVFGSVTTDTFDLNAEEPRWHVIFDDGNEEDFETHRKLARALYVYQENKEDDPKSNCDLLKEETPEL